MAACSAFTAQSGPSSASCCAKDKTGVHSAPRPLCGPQEPAPEPSNALTAPAVSMATGTKSSLNPIQRSLDPGLRGKRPAATSARVWDSKIRKSRTSSESAGVAAKSERVTTRSNVWRAAKATLRPDTLNKPMGMPLKVYNRSIRRDVRTATKSTPQATASGASSPTKDAEKTAFSHLSAGRSRSRGPPVDLLPAAKQVPPGLMEAICSPS
mmetsp:Transcript_33781/g.61254  ORF Transcript_33781/g.61254 Transcript_33781/m.61254 type:complete len:211 (-) Transcript_33781:390-1022(-)